MMKEDIYNKLKNSKLGIKPANNSEARQLIKIFKDYNLIREDDDEPSFETYGSRYVYIEDSYWYYDFDNKAMLWVDKIITYQEFVSKYLTEDINSNKKDLIKKLIDEYLEKNEISIQEELILKRFGDFCKERL